MTYRIKLLIILCTAWISFAHAGGIKKCLNPDGSITYTQLECKNNAKKESVTIEDSSFGNESTPENNYYSPANQLKRMKHERRVEQERRALKRQRAQQERNRRESEKAQQEEDARLAEHRCDLYRSYEKQAYNRMKSGYRTEAEKLSNENDYNYWKLEANRYCQ